MLSAALVITLALVVMALLMNLYRLTIGPDLPDRVLALDTMYVNSIALIVLLGLWLNSKT
ncbi:monovalent cation/H+ antiporter complex subunit F, partial [Halomonas sp. 3D7M]